MSMPSCLRPCLAALLLACACSSPRSGAELRSELDRAMGYCETRINANEPMEAFRLYEAVRSVDPAFPGVEAAGEAFRTQQQLLGGFFDHEWLGSNHAQRMPDEAGLAGQILLYLPDRLLDILDMFSFDVHWGLGAYADVHATRAVQFVAGARAVSGVGWHGHRSLGMLSQADTALVVLPFGGHATSASLVGSSGIISGSWTEGPLHRPSDDLYADFADYWAVGGSATAGIVGVSVDVHPVQIFDMLVGWATFDPGNDDLAHTRGSRLTDGEHEVIRSLGRAARDEQELAGYRAFQAQRAGSDEADADNPLIDG